MYLDDLRTRLLELARRRVRSGLLTERGLARSAGMSQPHVHNVLKNVRTLSLESADRLLIALQITAADLMVRFPSEEELGARIVPFLRSRIGPGIAPQFRVFDGYFPVPARLVKDLIDPVVARVAPDLSLPAVIEAHDTVLLDQNPAWRLSPLRDSPYVIYDGESAFIRFVRLSGNRIYLADAYNRPNPQSWQSLSLQGRDILELVRARIVWISREIGATPPGSSDSPGESD